MRWYSFLPYYTPSLLFPLCLFLEEIPCKSFNTTKHKVKYLSTENSFSFFPLFPHHYRRCHHHHPRSREGFPFYYFSPSFFPFSASQLSLSLLLAHVHTTQQAFTSLHKSFLFPALLLLVSTNFHIYSHTQHSALFIVFFSFFSTTYRTDRRDSKSSHISPEYPESERQRATLTSRINQGIHIYE